MIEKKTIVDQIEVARNGALQIRLGLLIVEDGVELSKQWHRTAVPPGHDVDAHMAAVNDHLTIMGKSVVPVSEIRRVKDIVRAAHTPGVVKGFADDRGAA